MRRPFSKLTEGLPEGIGETLLTQLEEAVYRIRNRYNSSLTGEAEPFSAEQLQAEIRVIFKLADALRKRQVDN